MRSASECNAGNNNLLFLLTGRHLPKSLLQLRHFDSNYYKVIYRYKNGVLIIIIALLLIILAVLIRNDNNKSISHGRRFYQKRFDLSTAALDQVDLMFELKDDLEWRLNDLQQVLGNAYAWKRRIRSISGSPSYFESLNSERNENPIELMNCEIIDKILASQPQEFIAAGWTKAVYEIEYPHHSDGQLKSKALALKFVDLNGQDISQCLKASNNSNMAAAYEACYEKAARKIVKEIVLLNLLQHPNVIKMIGYCIPKSFNSTSGRKVTLMTELGEPVDLIKLLRLGWEDRFRIVFSLVKLLKFLSKNPLGSLVLNDLRRQQFVLVDGELKLVDVDDVGLEEPKCGTSADCWQLAKNLKNSNQQNDSKHKTVPRTPINCQSGYCRGFNALKNMYNTARHFTTFLLPYGPPPEMQDQVDQVVLMFKDQPIPTDKLLTVMERLVLSYASGSYLKQRLKSNQQAHFHVSAASDLGEENDYLCRGSSNFRSCALSVSNVEEAENMCRSQPVCQAFVWTNEKSWTGRNIVYFKNNASHRVKNAKTTLFTKIQS